MISIYPEPNKNGTSVSKLIQQNANAISKITEAISAINAAAPRCEDYVVAGAHAFSMAVADHDDRITVLEEVRNDLNQIIKKLTNK